MGSVRSISVQWDVKDVSKQNKKIEPQAAW